MTCEFLPPTLTTSHRVRAIVASARPVLRFGGPDAEVVLIDGSTCTYAQFATKVAVALRHDGQCDPLIQKQIDIVLTTAGYAPTYEERRLSDFRPLPVASGDDEPGWRYTAKIGALALTACLFILAVQLLWGDTERRAAATMAQAEQAQFMEVSR